MLWYSGQCADKHLHSSKFLFSVFNSFETVAVAHLGNHQRSVMELFLRNS